MKSKSYLSIAAVVATLAVAPAFASPIGQVADAPSTKSEQPGTDTWITTKVKADLLASDGVPGTDITVDTKNGTVWLSGDVQTTAQRDRAIAKAKAIKGVKRVKASKLTVGGK